MNYKNVPSYNLSLQNLCKPIKVEFHEIPIYASDNPQKHCIKSILSFLSISLFNRCVLVCDWAAYIVETDISEALKNAEKPKGSHPSSKERAK